MNTQALRLRTAYPLGVAAVVVCANFVTGKLALLLAIAPGVVAPVWPPAGIGLAAIVLFGYRLWPAVWLASFLVNITVPAQQWPVAAAIAAGSLLQALAGAYLLRRFARFPNLLRRLRDVLLLLGLGGPVAGVVGATIGVTASTFAGIMEWSEFPMQWSTWLMGDCIGVFVFTPLTLLVGARPEDVILQRRLGVAGPLAVALMLTVVFFAYAQHLDKERVRALFQDRAGVLAIAAQRTVAEHLAVVSAVSGLYRSSDYVSSEEFALFARRLLEVNRGLRALAWAPRVRETERGTFEAAARTRDPQYRVVEQADNGQLVDAGAREEYFPVLYLDPRAGNEIMLGYDLGRDPTSGDALRLAAETGAQVASAPLQLPQRGPGQYGVLVFEPVYQRDAQGGSVGTAPVLTGFIVAVVALDALVESALEGYDRTGLVVSLDDEAAAPAERVLYASRTDLPTRATAAVRVTPREELVRKVSLPMPHRQWTLTMSATREFLHQERAPRLWLVLLGGFMFTGVLGTSLLVLTGHAEIIAELAARLSRTNLSLAEQVEERRRAEQMAERRRSELQRVLDAVNAEVWYLDTGARVVWHNRCAAEASGLDAHSVRGRTVVSLFPELDNPTRSYTQSLEVLRSGQPLLGSVESVRRAGRIVWLNIEKIPVPDEHGKIAGLLMFCYDITTQKQARDEVSRLNATLEQRVTERTAQLEDANEALRATLASLGEAQRIARLGTWEMAVVDEDALENNPFRWSEEAYRILGLPPDAPPLTESAYEAMAHPEDRARVAMLLLGLLREGGRTEITYRIIRPDSTERVVQERCEAITDPQTGRILRLIGSIQDITEQVRADQQIRKLTEELERRVQERTADLKVANKELESFSYSVSHDLRAPLRRIESFARILAEDYGTALDTQGNDYLGRIRSGVSHMQNLIEDLLQLATVSRVTMHRECVDMSEVVRAIVADLRHGSPERPVELVVQPEVTAWGDARLLRIALENLLGNAWKFTSRHPVARIEFGAQSEAGTTVYFIRDDGAGFNMAYAAKLFGAFQRLHSPNEFSGTGVGLATVQRIVHRHGGRIWAESTVERGATFYFTIA